MSTPSPSLGRQTFSAVAWLSALNGLGGVGMIALAWWLNRRLPDAPVQMGQWSVVLSLLLMTSLFFEGGISAVIQQRQQLGTDALAALSWLQILSGCAGAGALALAARPVAHLMASDADSDQMTHLIRLASICVAVIAAGLTPKVLLQREMRFRTVASVEGGATLVTIVLAVLLVPRMRVSGLVVASIVRYAVETTLYWSLGEARPWTILSRPRWSRAKEPLRAALAMGAQSILGTAVRQGDVLLIGAIAGVAPAGLYRQIQQLVVQPYAKLTMYVARAAFPAIARVQGDPERMLRGVSRMQRLLSLAVLPLQFGLAAVAPRLLAEFLGAQYRPYFGEAVPTMALLCLAAAIMSYTLTLVVSLNAVGLGEAVLWRQLAGSTATFLLMAAGSWLGLVGIAAGRVVALVFQASILLSLTERQFRFDRLALARSVREALPAASACLVVAVGVGAMLSRGWPTSAPFGGSAMALRAALLLQVAAGGAAYGVTLLALKVDPRTEWRALRT